MKSTASTDPQQSSLENLVYQYYPGVRQLAESILADPDEADDAAQEAFISAAAGLANFAGVCSLRTWLYRIAVNTCIDHLRRRKSRRRLENMIALIHHVFARQPSPEEILLENDADEHLWQAVRRLDEKHRLPVILYYQYDLPVAEISQVLGITEGTVHSRLFYARQHLMQALKSTLDTPADLEEVCP